MTPSVSDVQLMDPATLAAAIRAQQKKEALKVLKKFRDSDEGKQLVDWALKTYRQLKSAREIEERQWKKNLAMYNGKQYLQVVKHGTMAGQLMERPTNPNQDRRTVNLTAPIVRTEISKLMSQKPSASVIPASSDDEDMFAAMAGEQVWESITTRRKLIATLTKAAFWNSITGNGIVKTYWDETMIDRDANIEGDVVWESVSPFNFLVPDLREEDLERQGYVINYYTKPLDWLQMFYSNELDGIDLQANTNAASEVLEETYLNMSASTKTQPDSCLVYEFWIKPGSCKYLKGGGRLVIVDKYLVDFSNDWPYQHGEFPFAHMGHILTGKFYRRSTLDDTNQLNEDYNSWRTHMNQARRRMGHPQFAAQKGSVNAARWSNETGLVVEYKPGFQAPTPLPLSQMPQYIMEEGQSIQADLEDISGQHEVSKGQAPPGVTAATAISYLQEQDDVYLTPTFQSFEQAVEKVARQTLELCVQFWDVKRLVKVAGSDSQFDTMLLMGADIENGTDIRIEPGSSLPTSKAARQQFIMDLMTAQFIPPDQGLELLEIGGSTKLVDQLKIDKRQAQRENIKMKMIDPTIIQAHQQQWQQQQQIPGNPMTTDQQTQQPLAVPPLIPVNDWDNHDIHIDTHNIYRKSQAYQYLDPAVQAEFEKHVNMHEQMKQQKMLQQAMAQFPTDGSVPGVSGVIDPNTGRPSGQMTDGSAPGIDSSQQSTADMGGDQGGVVG
jgi:hypothetical protein